MRRASRSSAPSSIAFERPDLMKCEITGIPSIEFEIGTGTSNAISTLANLSGVRSAYLKHISQKEVAPGTSAIAKLGLHDVESILAHCTAIGLARESACITAEEAEELETLREMLTKALIRADRIIKNEEWIIIL